MAIIAHEWNDQLISQTDCGTTIAKRVVPKGYVNATQMCNANGKKWADYKKLKSTKEYWQALSIDMNIVISALVVEIDAAGSDQSTWVHPEISIDCAKWVSVPFRIWANRTLMRVILENEKSDESSQNQAKIPPDVEAARVATNISDIHKHLSPIDPRLAQILIDHSMRTVLYNQASASPSGNPEEPKKTRLAGVVEIAIDMGYKVGKEERSLGKSIAGFWRDTYGTEPECVKRECGGAFRSLKAYPFDNVEVREAIACFYENFNKAAA